MSGSGCEMTLSVRYDMRSMGVDVPLAEVQDALAEELVRLLDVAQPEFT